MSRLVVLFLDDNLALCLSGVRYDPIDGVADRGWVENGAYLFERRGNLISVKPHGGIDTLRKIEQIDIPDDIVPITRGLTRGYNDAINYARTQIGKGVTLTFLD